MKSKDKRMMAGNLTLDQFLTNRHQQPVRKGINNFTVPMSSGYPPSSPPVNNKLMYPKNPEVREYQQEIVLNCVVRNTLVCLPTGLGKTHIAAVLMANFIRWFPDKKVIFLAPTRPLVRQQVSALNHLREMVPKSVVLQVSGQMAAKKREQLYQSFRVIFATPQTIENDLRHGKLDRSKIIMLIFDECHRSTGEASYAKIIRLMGEVEAGYRVVGLSATPGHELERVQAVISNLNISKLIYKDEKDPEVKRYLNEKVINEVVVRSTDSIAEIVGILNEFAKPSISLLVSLKGISPWVIRNGIKNTSFYVIREDFLQKATSLKNKQKAICYRALEILRFLIQSRKSLCERGYETFKRTFFGSLSSPNPSSLPPKAQLEVSEETNSMAPSLDRSTSDPLSEADIAQFPSFGSSLDQNSNTNNGKSSTLPSKFVAAMTSSPMYHKLYSLFFDRKTAAIHPKLQKLIEILTSFFSNSTGRVIIFTNFRVTAKEIQSYLEHVPSIKSELFFGQSKTVFQESEQETRVIYLKQSEQLKIVERFKGGEINTLISTCIGEEGLDIGEVDCIVCYDGGHSPIRSIQRRGRTGRKRAGCVHFLLMEGKEWDDYRNGLKKEEKMKKMLTKELHKFQYYSYNSTLFQEKSEIVVEHFDNQVQSADQELLEKETKPKRGRCKKEESRGAETKRRRKNKKAASTGSESEQQKDVEIKVTKIEDLLHKYKQSQDSEQPQTEESWDQKQKEEESEEVGLEQIIQEDANQDSEIEQGKEQQVESCTEGKTKEEQLPAVPESQNSVHLSPHTAFLQSQDEEGSIFLQYLRCKADHNNNSQQTAIALSDSDDSISSDEFRQIMDKITTRKQLSKLPLHPDDDSL